MTIESNQTEKTAAPRGGRRFGGRVLAAVGLLAAVAVVPGCFGDSNGYDPAPVCVDGQIQTGWALSQGGQTVECAPGDEVDVTVDGRVTTFACSGHSGTIEVAGAYNHDVSLALYDANNLLLSSASTMQFYVDCGAFVQTPTVDFSLTP